MPVLRQLTVDDAAAVLKAFASDTDMVRQGDVHILSQAKTYVTRLIDPDSEHRPWAVVADQEVVGLVCVSVDDDNKSGWFWYWMNAQARGRGWTKRGAATVANWALNQAGLERLELGHRVNNPASGAVARFAGFIKEGTERGKFLVNGQRIDVDTYGRLRSDPTPSFTALPMLDA